MLKRTYIKNVSIDLKEVMIAGWITVVRKMKHMIFVDLRDETGSIQVVVSHRFFHVCKQENVIRVTGSVQTRKQKTRVCSSQDTQDYFYPITDIEISCYEQGDIVLLGKNLHTSFSPYNITHLSEDTLLKQRCYYLRSRVMQNNLRQYANLKKAIRQYWDDKGHVEMTTPLLSSPSAEGSAELYVSSTVDSARSYSLSQSPQLFKQLLIASGFERYYQIAPCFRDENLRSDRQIQFEQVDIECAFANVNDIMSQVEDMIRKVCDLFNKTIDPFALMPFHKSLELYGSDKPDLRIKPEYLIQKYTSKYQVCVPASRADIDAVLSQYGDVYTVTSTPHSNVICWNTSRSRFCDFAPIGKLIKKFSPRVESDVMKPVWIVDYPLICEKEDGIQPGHHPFAKIKDRDFHHKLQSDSITFPYKGQEIIGCDLVINGIEIGSGGERETNPHMIKEYLNILGVNDLTPFESLFYYLEAGTPPHAGFGIGLERLAMLLFNLHTIRDTIPFPKTQGGYCYMCRAPIGLRDKNVS